MLDRNRPVQLDHRKVLWRSYHRLGDLAILIDQHHAMDRPRDHSLTAVSVEDDRELTLSEPHNQWRLSGRVLFEKDDGLLADSKCGGAGYSHGQVIHHTAVLKDHEALAHLPIAFEAGDNLELNHCYDRLILPLGVLADDSCVNDLVRFVNQLRERVVEHDRGRSCAREH